MRAAASMAKTRLHVRETERLIEDHLYLVQHIVQELAARYPRHIDRQELRSAGFEGLVEAAHRYDPGAGVPFASYASIRIRGAIIDATRTRDWATRRLRRQHRELTQAAQRFEARAGHRPDQAELAAELGVSVAEVTARRAAADAATLLHLDAPRADGDDAGAATLGELVPERDGAWLPDEALEQQELLGTVRTAVALLPPNQRNVIERHFFDGEILRDIAATLGVSEARVSQLRAEALNAIRAYFASAFDAVPDVAAGAPGVRRRAAYVTQVRARSTWRSRLDGVTDPIPATVGSRCA